MCRVIIVYRLKTPWKSLVGNSKIVDSLRILSLTCGNPCVEAEGHESSKVKTVDFKHGTGPNLSRGSSPRRRFCLGWSPCLNTPSSSISGC